MLCLLLVVKFLFCWFLKRATHRTRPDSQFCLGVDTHVDWPPLPLVPTLHQSPLFSLSSLLASPRQRYSSIFSPVWKSWHTFWWTGEMGVRGHGMSKSRRTPRMTAWEPSGVKVHSPKAQGLVIFYQQWHGCGDLPAGLGTQQS